MYHAVAEGGCAQTSGFEPWHYEELAGHVAPRHAAFVAHWMALLDWEEAGARSRRSELWALPGARRRVGRLLRERRRPHVGGAR